MKFIARFLRLTPGSSSLREKSLSQIENEQLSQHTKAQFESIIDRGLSIQVGYSGK